jgi:hypothetical protein
MSQVSKESRKWQNDAFRFVEAYVSHPAIEGVVVCEDIRAWAEENGLPNPPDTRAWGSVMRRASDAQLVINNGVRRSHNGSRHQGYVTEWVKY